MIQQQHVIKQQILELLISSDAHAFELQNQISALYRSQIVSLIEHYCNQYSIPDTIQRIDRIEIDLGEIEAELLDIDFAQKVAEALSIQLPQLLTTSTAQSTDPVSRATADSTTSQVDRQARATSFAQSRFELFSNFIQSGTLPWWSDPLDKHSLEECFSQLLADSSNNLRVLFQSNLKQEQILQRILYQFSESMRMEVLKLLAPTLQPSFRAYLEDIQRLIPYIESFQKLGSQELNQILWQGIFLYLSLSQSFPHLSTELEIDKALQANLLHIASQLSLDGRSLIDQLLKASNTLETTGIQLNSKLLHILTIFFDPNKEQTRVLTRPSNNGTDQTIDPKALSSNQLQTTYSANTIASIFYKTEEIYIQNAGMVLLWPFLKRFLENLNLVESGKFLDLQATHRAILLLQYLVDKSLETLEPTLPLNKLLCGLNISAPIPANLAIAKDEQTECEGLLLALIQNWSVLGNISTTGLRQSFLQRAGILRLHHDSWLLQIEHKAHDILLNKLPWSIQIIKLPWMKQLLYTEW